MKLDPRMRSRNVHDRRGLRGGRAAAGGGGLLVAGLIVASFIFPDELRPVLQILGVDGPGGAASQQQAAPIDDEINAFVSITLGYTEDFWSDAFASGAVTGESAPYQPATVVLFTGSARSQCGAASAQTGPFYCPADQSIYIDPDFYDVMATQLRSPGDFAQAYVIAHEVAHHVQNLAGVLRQVHQAKVRSNDPVMGNRLTVRLELQADCFAGVWARRTDEKHQILEQGDLGEALNAAYRVGDDVLQRMSGARVDPTQFTHGTAEQRSRWFRTGYETGDLGRCDTFRGDYADL